MIRTSALRLPDICDLTLGPCWLGTLPVWDEMLGALPRGAAPTDIDGFLEMNGRFLFIETKRAGEGLSRGQTQALRRLARQPRTTVLWITGPDEGLYDYHVRYGDAHISTKGGKDHVTGILQRWYAGGYDHE